MTSAREEEGSIELADVFCACGVDSGVVAIAVNSCTSLAACAAAENVFGSCWITKVEGIKLDPVQNL